MPSKKNNFYICDPRKNTKCAGRYQDHCGLQCFCTTNPEFAKEPVHALTHEEYYREEGARMHIIPRR